MPAVRLFIGNLPYNATEDDIRSHFATVGLPTQIVRPLDRETGRARGLRLRRIRRTRAWPKRPSSASTDSCSWAGRWPSARRAPATTAARVPPRPGGYSAPRPGGPGGAGCGAPRPGGYSPRPPGEGGYAPRPGGFAADSPAIRRSPTRPSRARATSARRRRPRARRDPSPASRQKERGPKGPIPTKFTGRVYGLDDEAEAAGAGADDALPDFMKAERPTATADAGRRRRSRRGRRRHAARRGEDRGPGAWPRTTHGLPRSSASSEDTPARRRAIAQLTTSSCTRGSTPRRTAWPC